MPDTIFQPYQALIKDIEKLSTSLDEIHGEYLTCHSGCSGCCQQDIGIFEVEAFHLRQAILSLPQNTRERIRYQVEQLRKQKQVSCSLLIDDCCSIYEDRPIICRTHGYPLHYEGEEEGEVFLDVCPLNFTEEGSIESISLDQTLPLDRLNLRLAAINHVYSRDELGDINKANTRIPLSELAGNTLKSNLH